MAFRECSENSDGLKERKYNTKQSCPVGTIPMETRTGPDWSTFATRTLNFDS